MDLDLTYLYQISFSASTAVLLDGLLEIVIIEIWAFVTLCLIIINAPDVIHDSSHCRHVGRGSQEVILEVVENLIFGLWGQGEIGESIIGLAAAAVVVHK